MRWLALACTILTAGGCSSGAEPALVSQSPVESVEALIADELYSCGGETGWPASVLNGPNNAEEGRHPANQKLGRMAARLAINLDDPGTGWIRVLLSEWEAVFVAESPGGHPYTYAEFQKKKEGWQLWGGGDCRPETAKKGFNPVEFDVREQERPAVEDTEIQVRANEVACHGFEVPPEGDLQPEIIYGREHVVVILRVEQESGFFTCPGTPPFPYTLELDEPLGERALVDASEYPPLVVAKVSDS